MRADTRLLAPDWLITASSLRAWENSLQIINMEIYWYHKRSLINYKASSNRCGPRNLTLYCLCTLSSCKQSIGSSRLWAWNYWIVNIKLNRHNILAHWATFCNFATGCLPCLAFYFRSLCYYCHYWCRQPHIYLSCTQRICISISCYNQRHQWLERECFPIFAALLFLIAHPFDVVHRA